MLLSPPDLITGYSLRLSLCLLWTLLVGFFRRRPCSLQVQSLLLPPHFSDPHPRPPHRFLAEVHNWSRRNVPGDRILTLQHIRLHPLKPLPPASLPPMGGGGGYSQLTSRNRRGCPPGKLSGHPLVEPPPSARPMLEGHHPRL